MTHQDKGHYAQKHLNATLNKAIADKITAASKDGVIDCASAHKIAKATGTAPDGIGVQIDLMELRITRCQLGLFGYGPQKKNLNPDVQVSDQLKADIINTQSEGSLSCSQCWELARRHKRSIPDMGSACEKIEIRIKPCQLGAF